MVKAGVTDSENVALLAAPALSVTLAVKLTGLDVAGTELAESNPALLMLSHTGSPVAAQEYGDVPAVAVNCCE
jgi:hypothetical protein